MSKSLIYVVFAFLPKLIQPRTSHSCLAQEEVSHENEKLFFLFLSFLNIPFWVADLECPSTAELYFVDTSPFVDKYWKIPNEDTYDWRGVIPRDTYLRQQLQVKL